MLLRASFIYTFSSFYFVLNFFLFFVFFFFIFAFKSINKMPKSPTVCFSVQTNENVFNWVFWKNPFVERISRAFNMCTNGWSLLIWNRYYWIWLKEAFGWLNNTWKCVRIEIYGNNEFLAQINKKLNCSERWKKLWNYIWVKIRLQLCQSMHTKEETKQTKINLSVMPINQNTICKFMIVVGSNILVNTIELHYKNPFVGPILFELHLRSWKLRYIWL